MDFLRDLWGKGIWFKAGLVGFGLLFWPLSLFILFFIFSQRISNSHIRLVMIIIVGIILSPVIFGWNLGLYYAMTGTKPPVNKLSSPIPTTSSLTSSFTTPTPTITFIPEATATPIIEILLSPTITLVKPTATQIPTPTIALTSTPVPSVAFDKNLGNNWVAAAQAQDFMDTGNKAAPGIIKSVFIELVPEDVGKKDIETYKKSITSAFVQVRISSSFWNSLDENTMKDFTASWVTATKNVFSGFPHIYIKNEVRTVAEGEWSLWSGEPKITLK